MNILIFGGAGYLGTHLVQQLIRSKQNKVSVFDAFTNPDFMTEKSFSERFPGVQIINQDIADSRAVQGAIDDLNPTVVINLAAVHFIPYCIEHPEVVQNTNIIGNRNIIQAIKYSDIRYLFASSASVYGNSSSEPISESHELAPVDIYGDSKVQSERDIQSQLSRYTILRLFNLYGDYDPIPHLIPKVASAAITNNALVLGSAHPRRDFVHVADVSRAFHLAIHAEDESIYNVGTASTHSVKEVVDSIVVATSCTNRIEYENARFVRKAETSILCAANDKIMRELGWKPEIQFAEGIASVIEAHERRVAVTS